MRAGDFAAVQLHHPVGHDPWLFKQEFSSKEFVTVAPPGRPFSIHIEKYADRRIALNRDHIARNLLPPILLGNGRPNARRPREYDPPASAGP